MPAAFRLSEEEILTPRAATRGGVHARVCGRLAALTCTIIARRFGITYPAEWHVRVRQLEEAGWILFDGSSVRLTSKGRLAANSVIEELLWPTPASTASI